MTGVFADSTYLTAWRKYDGRNTHLVIKPSGIGSGIIVYSAETDWSVIDFLVDSRGCVLLFECTWTWPFAKDARLRVLSFNTMTSSTTRDLGHIEPDSGVCVQITEFYLKRFSYLLNKYRVHSTTHLSRRQFEMTKVEYSKLFRLLVSRHLPPILIRVLLLLLFFGPPA